MVAKLNSNAHKTRAALLAVVGFFALFFFSSTITKNGTFSFGTPAAHADDPGTGAGGGGGGAGCDGAACGDCDGGGNI